MKTKKEYQPKTGKSCGCRSGIERDNCPGCEGTGMRIDFKAIRDTKAKHTPLNVIDDNGDLKLASAEYGIIAAFEDECGVPFEEATRMNRAYIVRAVNAHEELLHAAKCMHERLHGTPDCTGQDCRFADAIAKAEGK